MELSLAQFENINLLSNKNVEKILKKLINESANAALVSTFDESVILYDHTNGHFYTGDYTLDKDNLKVVFENFEQIDLKEFTDTTEEIVESFFDDVASAQDISEAYKNEVVGKAAYVKELVNEALSEKNFYGKPDYIELTEAKAQLEMSSKNLKFFESYQERIKAVPMTKIMSFDWKSSVNVSLNEEEKERIVASVNVGEAHNLWRKKEFKAQFQEAATSFIDEVVEGAELFEELAREYPAIMFLESEDRKALFGKSMLGNKTLTENLGDVLKGLDVLFEKLDLKDLREEYEGLVQEEGENPAYVLGENEISAIEFDLKNLLEFVDDKGTVDYIENLIEEVGSFRDNGVSPAVVKEVVALIG